MLARQRADDSGEPRSASIDVQVADLEFFGASHRRVQLRCSSFKYGRSLWALPRKDRRNSGLQDPGLLARDGLDGVSQVRLVIEIDGRDHGKSRLHHVGRIQAPAEADLYNGRIDLFLAK